jgi:branched-chain amino acid transport system substrate-binding protein
MEILMFWNRRQCLNLAAYLCASVAPLSLAQAADRPIKVSAFGALTGPVKSFGINSRAALEAAADRINREGGVKLGDGTVGQFEISYSDDHCKADDGIAIVGKAAESDALFALGPSCSSVAEPLYGVLPQQADDTNRQEYQIPVFTDGATKAKLARISAWAFRNAPNEGDIIASCGHGCVRTIRR